MDSIKNINDVKRFFLYLYEECKVAFHPDDSFDCYVDMDSHTPAFTSSECKKFDKMMEECFKVCEEAGVSIYDFACGIRDQLIRDQLVSA